MKYGSVIFDMDGVILDSLVENEEWKFKAVEKALQETGVNIEEVSRDDMRILLGEKGREEFIRKCGGYKLDAAETWRLIANTTSLARIKQVKTGSFQLYEGAEEFVDTLHTNEIKIALISNAPESAVETTMKLFDLKKYFDFYRGVEDFSDLKLRKPNPDHIEIAEAELKEKPSLYIGDKESDVKAAKNAGIDSALVNRKNIQTGTNPEYIVSDLEELGEKLGVL